MRWEKETPRERLRQGRRMYIGRTFQLDVNAIFMDFEAAIENLLLSSLLYILVSYSEGHLSLTSETTCVWTSTLDSRLPSSESLSKKAVTQ